MKSTEQKEDHLIVMAEFDSEPFAKSGDFVFARTRPLEVKDGDMVLMPRACPLATYWYMKTFEKSTVPFKIFRVSKVFEKRGCSYIKTEEGLEVPVEYLIGVVNSIMSNTDLSQQNIMNKS